MHPPLRNSHYEDETVYALVSLPLCVHLLRGHLAAVIDLDVTTVSFTDHYAVRFGATDSCIARHRRILKHECEVGNPHFVFDLVLLASSSINHFWPACIAPLHNADYWDSLPLSLFLEPSS